MFRHKMAKVAPTEVLVAKKMKVITLFIVMFIEYVILNNLFIPQRFDASGRTFWGGDRSLPRHFH